MSHRCMAGNDEEGRAQVLKEVAQASLATDHWPPSVAPEVCTLVFLCAVVERLHVAWQGEQAKGVMEVGYYVELPMTRHEISSSYPADVLQAYTTRCPCHRFGA